MPIRIGKVTMFVPYTVYDNPDYVITIEGQYDNKTIHEHVYVTENCYNSLSPGTTWYKTEDCSYSDTNNTKERK